MNAQVPDLAKLPAAPSRGAVIEALARLREMGETQR